MTNEQKFTAIVERLKLKDILIDPEYISIMVILHYLDEMAKLGLVDAGMKPTDNGEKVIAVVEEFDWKITDEHIDNFVSELVESDGRDAISHFLKEYRDDRVKFIKNAKKLKKK